MLAKDGWARNDKAAVVYTKADDPTVAVVIFPGSLGVSLDGETQADNLAVLLEMGGQGGIEVSEQGIASDFIDDWNWKQLPNAGYNSLNANNLQR